MMSRQKRELPLPGDVAPPPRRPLPGTPMAGPNQGPAPPLPSRGGGTPGRKALPTPEPPGKLPSRNPLDRRGDAHPIPSPRQSHASRLPPPTPSRGPPSHVQKQESVTSDDGDIYNEADVGEVYQECEPEQDDYDQFEYQEDSDSEQEEYSEFDVGAEVEEEPQETYDDFDIHADQQDTYEISDDVTDEVYQEMAEADPLPPPPPSRPIPQPPKNASPAPPPPPPPQSKRAPLEKKPARPKPPAVQKPMGGGLDLSEVLKKRGNLKKVESAEERPISSNDIKEYATGEDVRSKFEIFRQKEEAAGLVSPTRTSALPKFAKTPSTETAPSPKSPGSRGALPPTPDEKPALPAKPADLPPPPPPLKSSNGRGSPELPPPPKMEDLQPPPPPKIKDSYTKVDPSTKSNVDSGKNTPLVQNGNQNDWPDDYDDDDGEIYDDVAATLADPLCAFPWYHNELEREEGNKKLKQISKDGCFLVRKASNKQRALTQPYTLMVYYSGYNYNLKVRLRSDQKFALGEEKADEVTFELVQDLICHHQKNEVILVHKSGKQYSTLLTVSPS
ncbi:actin cytoskeleton-regulatory complex protein PAN1-like isoform X4 [Pecten maximus]|uniref:actin cytoskeleton-regulatory complex protein PAN1-like isoform X4 n=1 Tax=Pecten maximus TaxID=6579 RepID=UPI0014585D5D|nr:actin cytoskeleton-regulatory complex protein PAN1-like isoform X4 [Pecten maximus]